MKKLLFSLGILFIANLSFAQAPLSIENIEEKYAEYFELNREIPFLHLNKNIVAPSENLWLSAYVYNPKLELPNDETVNLKVDIFNEKGNYIDTETVLINFGKGAATIDLASKELDPGTYILKASTKYMKNFDENLEYIERFTILGDEEQKASAKSKAYDLQILPEGGHLLADVINSVGVKLIDESGKGVDFKNAQILDEEGNEISSFSSNQFGISKFNLKPIPGKNYSVLIKTDDGEEIRTSMEKPKEKGISISSNSRDEEFIFTIKTNEETKENLDSKKFHLAIHKDGFLNQLEFEFPENGLDVNVKVLKDSLFSGVNTITVFNDDLQPLAERMVFNDKKIKRGKINAELERKENDSLVLALSSDNIEENASLSISVLPSATKAYNSSHNILSAFYLKPYLKGNIENPEYYFTDGEKRKKFYDLDLLLLTQGWSKYSWENIYKNPPKEKYMAENAFSMEGTVSNRTKRQENLYLKSEDLGIFELIDIKKDDSFTIDSLYIFEETELSFGVVKRGGKIKKPNLNVDISPNDLQANLSKKEIENLYLSSSQHAKIESFNADFIDTSVNLDTVKLVGNNNPAAIRNETRVDEEEIQITEDLAKRYHYVTDLIEAEGFYVRRRPMGGLEIRSNSRLSLRSPDRSPLLVFNGAPIQKDPNILIDLQTSQLESITINKNGFGYGVYGGNGVIKIEMKKGYDTRSDKDITTVIADKGFSRNKEFYAPKYKSYTAREFKDYGSIAWKPYTFFEPESNNEIKVFNTAQPELKLFIEGITADGTLISEVLQVKTN